MSNCEEPRTYPHTYTRTPIYNTKRERERGGQRRLALLHAFARTRSFACLLICHVGGRGPSEQESDRRGMLPLQRGEKISALPSGRARSQANIVCIIHDERARRPALQRHARASRAYIYLRVGRGREQEE